MEYDFHKGKLPKGLSYPIKRSVLDKILEDSRTNRIKWISFSANQREKIILWANFIGEGQKNANDWKYWIVYLCSSVGTKKTDGRNTDKTRISETCSMVEEDRNGWRRLAFKNEIV